MNKDIYQLYTSDCLLREYSTDYILTLDNIHKMLTDEMFLADYEHYFYHGLIGYNLLPVNDEGNHLLILKRLDCFGDIVEDVFTLVKMNKFL